MQNHLSNVKKSYILPIGKLNHLKDNSARRSLFSSLLITLNPQHKPLCAKLSKLQKKQIPPEYGTKFWDLFNNLKFFLEKFSCGLNTKPPMMAINTVFITANI
jgi:hypothetical protein